MKQARVVGRTTVLGLCAAVALAVGYQAVSGQTGRPAGTVKPDENRFSAVVVVPPGELDEPMAFEVLENGQVYIIERKGRVEACTTRPRRPPRLIATIPVNTKYTSAAGVSARRRKASSA